MTGASKKTCLALCDMTNVPSKRGISSILGDFLLKSGDDSGKTVAREGSGVKFSKRLCLVVDDLVKESTRTSDTNEDSSSDDKNSLGFGDSGNCDLVDVKESQGETNEIVMGVDCNPKTCENDSDIVFASQTNNFTGEDLAMTVFSNSQSDEKLVKLETMNSEGTGLLLPNSQTMKSFSMNRCDGMGIVEADGELQVCSCSLCLKAAYIWSDLHYQDIKGRLSVLKKSQKEANNLIQRNIKGKPTDLYESENLNNSTNGEFGFNGQWTSLFLNMESILARESNHLQSSFVAMKDLREKCKIDLERDTKTTQDNKS